MKPQITSQLVNQLTNECCENISDVLLQLGIHYKNSYRRLVGCCPIHGGDNPSAFNLYPQGEEVRGYWVCRTHHCEKKWKATLVGLIHAMLSAEQGKQIPWTAAVDWMIKFLGYKSITDVKTPTTSEILKNGQANAIHKLNIKPQQKTTGWTRERVRKTLEIPAEYFVNRGYSRDILDKYDIGFYPKVGRVLAPMYDDDHKNALGFVGRSIYERCEKCKLFHKPGEACPVDIADQFKAAKWKNSEGFDTGNYLYNYWFAREHIIKSNLIILVEGVGDVLKLEMSGIHNAVALFGTNISDEQVSVIEGSWASNIIVLLDTDEAGIEGCKNIQQQFKRTHKLYFPNVEGKDVGGMQVDRITAEIQPIIDKVKTFQQKIGVDK